MGGKSKTTKGRARKNNDRVDLKPIGRGVGGSGGGSGNTGQGMMICPTAFEINLPEASNLPSGTALSLRQRGEEWVVIARGNEIAKLRKERANMLSRCLADGYRYSGVVRTRADRKYGEFQRSS